MSLLSRLKNLFRREPTPLTGSVTVVGERAPGPWTADMVRDPDPYRRELLAETLNRGGAIIGNIDDQGRLHIRACGGR